jgi:hypothetical protein
MQTTPSALVVGDSGNLPNSQELPFEIFPAIDLASNDEMIKASPEELARTGLRSIFDPDPAKSIRPIPLSDSIVTIGSLLVKAPPDSMPNLVKEICRNHAAELNSHVAEAWPLVIQYEWEILKHTFRCPSPCLVTDTSRTVVSSNNILCDMLGRAADEVIGAPLDDLVYFERESTSDIPYNPECIEITTPLLVKPLFLFFTTNVSLTRISTVCGDRLIYVFQDIYPDRRAGNSNILLIQKLSNMAISEGPPQTVIRRLINLLTLTLNCDLVCVLRRKRNKEMIVTPYSNRRIDTSHANVIEAAKEPVLEPFFMRGNPVFCDNVEQACPEPSFFRQISPLSRFALLPVGDGTGSEYAVLAAWSKPDTTIGPEAVPLLRIIANLLGSVLTTIRLVTENDQEKETLRRYTRLTAGREIRMANLKRENAQLRELVMKLSAPEKE